eukprot:scaffold44582_cov18-Tisochrysis_lutea.AAC.2
MGRVQSKLFCPMLLCACNRVVKDRGYEGTPGSFRHPKNAPIHQSLANYLRGALRSYGPASTEFECPGVLAAGHAGISLFDFLPCFKLATGGAMCCKWACCAPPLVLCATNLAPSPQLM